MLCLCIFIACFDLFLMDLGFFFRRAGRLNKYFKKPIKDINKCNEHAKHYVNMHSANRNMHKNKVSKQSNVI